MSAQHVINLLSDYAEGDIAPAAAAKVKAHLTFCWSCRQALAETKDHIRELRATPTAAVPAGLEARVLAKVRQEREKPMAVAEPKRSGWPSWFTPLRGFAFAATCALAIVVVRSIPNDGARQGKDFSFAPKKQAVDAAPPAPQGFGGEGAAGERRKDAPPPPPADPAKAEAKEDAVSAPPAQTQVKAAPLAAAQAPAESDDQAAARAALAERREARRLRRQEAARPAVASGAGAVPETPPAAPARVAQVAQVRGAAESAMQGSRSSIQTRTELVVNSQGEWESTWKLHHAAADTIPPLPAVDFTTSQVLAIFAGERPTAGHRVEIVSVDQATWNGAPARIVRYRVTAPRPGAVAAQVITYPYLFSVQPRFDGSTFFEQESETPR